MAFEVFSGRGAKATAKPRVTLGKNGLLSANSACRQQWLADANAVQLLYDAQRKIIGIRPVAVGTEHSYTFRPGKSGGQISGSAFLKHYGIAQTKTMAYDAKWDDKAKAVVFNL